MGADGSRRARAGLGGPDGPTPGRGANPPGETYSPQRRRRCPAPTAALHEHCRRRPTPRGGCRQALSDLTTPFPRPSPWLLRLRLGAWAGLCLWPAPFPTCPCAEGHKGHREHRSLWSTGELPAIPIRVRTIKVSTVLGIYTTGPGGVFIVSHVVACTCLEHVYRIAKSAFFPIGMSIGDPNRPFWRQIGIGIAFPAQNADENADRHLHRLSEEPINGRRQRC